MGRPPRGGGKEWAVPSRRRAPATVPRPPRFFLFARPGPAAALPRFSLLSQRASPPQPSHTNAPVCLPARRPGRPGRPRGRQQRGRGGPGFRVGRGSRARHPPARRVQRHQACGVDGSKGGPDGGAGGRCVLSECGGEGEGGGVCGPPPPRLFLTLSLLSPILHTRSFPALPIQKFGPCGSKVREALVGRWWWWLWGWWALRALATNLSPSLPPAPHPLFFLFLFCASSTGPATAPAWPPCWGKRAGWARPRPRWERPKLVGCPPRAWARQCGERGESESECQASRPFSPAPLPWGAVRAPGVSGAGEGAGRVAFRPPPTPATPHRPPGGRGRAGE